MGGDYFADDDGVLEFEVLRYDDPRSTGKTVDAETYILHDGTLGIRLSGFEAGEEVQVDAVRGRSR